MWRETVTSCAQTCADFLGVPIFWVRGHFLKKKMKTKVMMLISGLSLSQSTVPERRNNRCHTRNTGGSCRKRPLSSRHPCMGSQEHGHFPLIMSFVHFRIVALTHWLSVLLTATLENTQNEFRGTRTVCAKFSHDLVPHVVQRFRERKVSNGCPLDAVPVSVDLEPAPDKERAAGGEHDQKAAPKAGGGEFSVQFLIGSADHDRMTRLGDTQEDAQTRSTIFWSSWCKQKDSKSHNIKAIRHA